MKKGKSRQTRRDRRNDRRQLKQNPADYEAAFDAPSPPLKAKRQNPLEAKNQAQGHLISNILSKDINFVTGPAGTGKTYIAATLALEELLAGRVTKILITRPMQDCDENMGALPGEIDEKYEPWVRPILDIFREHMTEGALGYALKSGKIEFCPLQFMRGSTFKNTWALLDEAQNVTEKQMKMFLTRIGENSKLIIDGDMKQSDLKGATSGLEDACRKLANIPEISFTEFTRDDIVRHGLVRKILDRYEG